MHKNLFSALLFVALSCVCARAGGVTNIKEIVNRSSKPVEVMTYEYKNEVESRWKTTNIISAGRNWTGDMWVPWADNQEQFQNHFMRIEITTRSRGYSREVTAYTAYQSAEFIRASLDRAYSVSIDEVGNPSEEFAGNFPSRAYNPNARTVEGLSQSGGERRIIFYDKPGGSVGFKFERF